MGTYLLVRALSGVPLGAATDWITAVSTLALGLFGFAFTGWQFWVQGFRPRCEAKIDANHQAVLLRIRNRGRADGVIERVVLIDAQGLGIEPAAEIDGYASSKFAPTILPAYAAMRLIISPPKGRDIHPQGVRVKVDWGTGEEVLAPEPVDVGYAGLPSVLPLQGVVR